MGPLASLDAASPSLLVGLRKTKKYSPPAKMRATKRAAGARMPICRGTSDSGVTEAPFVRPDSEVCGALPALPMASPTAVLCVPVMLDFDFPGTTKPPFEPSVVCAWLAVGAPIASAAPNMKASVQLRIIVPDSLARSGPSRPIRANFEVLAGVLLAPSRPMPSSLLRSADNLLASLSDPFCALDGDWRFTFVNPPAAAFFGKAGEELLGRDVWSEFPALRDSLFEREMRRVALDPNGARSRFVAPWPASERWLDITIARVPAASDGEGAGVSLFFRDASRDREQLELARLQTAARQHEERLRQIAGATGVALWVWEPGRDIIHYQHALDTFYGFPIASLGELTPYIHPDDLGGLQGGLAGALESGRTTQLDFRVGAQPGTAPWRWIQAIVSRTHTDDGEPLFLGVNSDVSERYEAQEQLAASATRLENVARETGVGLWQWNPRTDELSNRSIWKPSRACRRSQWTPCAPPFTRMIWRDCFRLPGARSKRDTATKSNTASRVFPAPIRALPTSGSGFAAKAGTTVSVEGDMVFAGFVFDISARRENELAVELSRDRLESVVREANIALWQWDAGADRVVEHVNLDEMFEVPGQSVNFTSTLEHTHPDDRNLLRDTVLNAVRERTPYEVEFRLLRRGTGGDPRAASHWKWVLIVAKPRAQGQSLLSGFAFDISGAQRSRRPPPCERGAIYRAHRRQHHDGVAHDADQPVH